MTLTKDEHAVLTKLAGLGGTGNVIEFLGYDISRFDEVFAFANELQNKDAVKLLYSNYNKNQVIVEITLVGKMLASA